MVSVHGNGQKNHPIARPVNVQYARPRRTVQGFHEEWIDEVAPAANERVRDSQEQGLRVQVGDGVAHRSPVNEEDLARSLQRSK